MNKIISKLISTVERRAWHFVFIAILLTTISIPGIFKLETETGLNTLVSSEAQVFQDTKKHDAMFGSEPLVILLEGNMTDIFSHENLVILSKLENEILAHDLFHSILSPVTILDLAISEALVQEEVFNEKITVAMTSATEEAMRISKSKGLDAAAQAALVSQSQQAVMKQFQPYIDIAKQIGEPSLENGKFIRAVLYNAEGELNPTFSNLIPADGHVFISISPVGNLTHEASLSLVEYIEKFFAHNPLKNVSTTIVLDALVIETIANEIGGNLTLLLALAVIVMGLILLFVFPVRWRLLSLVMVGISAIWTFGLMGYLGVPLSMATMAVLPVLIGLGIDYSVQFHNHFQEKLDNRDSINGALVSSAIRMFPAAGIALFATVIGFITLYISEVPMVRDFGVILSVGVFLSYLSALFLLHSVLYLLEKKTPIQKLKKSADKQRLLEKILSKMAKKVLNSPLPILIVAVIFGIIGIYSDSQLESSTDFKELMSQDSAVLQDIEKISAIPGAGPPTRFLIEANDVTSPEFIQWLYKHHSKLIEDFPELLGVESIATLISKASNGKIPNSQNEINMILENTPAIFTNQFISSNKKMTSLVFSGNHISMEEQNELIKQIELASSTAPDNTRMVAVGSVALGASTVDSIMGRRFLLNMLCLFAIMLVLLIVYKRLVSVLLTIIAVGLVISWSSLVLYIANIPLNPLTAILGVIVIGIGTEFMVLIISRYEDEKKKGSEPTEAMITAISKIGRAVVITALTTLGGFGVLMTSDFVLIRDFGIATVSGVFLCLISSMIVMPPLLVFFDEKLLPGKK